MSIIKCLCFQTLTYSFISCSFFIIGVPMQVGYHGRDVDSIIRDLVDTGIHTVRNRRRKAVAGKAARAAENAILHALLSDDDKGRTRREMKTLLRSGALGTCKPTHR
jgi:ATP-dependent protease HslVU (ClpYQ) ATPase subunit